VTSQAQTKTGLFKVHRIGERLLFEIPRREMNKDILLVQEIAQTALGAGYDGAPAGNRVVRFERRDNRVLLRGVSNEIIASDTLSPVAGAVAASNVQPVIAVFNVEAYGPDSAAVIDVSRLFTQPPPELSPAQRIAAGYQVDATRSWIEHASSFPDNVNVYSTLTLAPGNNGARGATPAPGRGGRGGGAGFAAPTAFPMSRWSRGSVTTALVTSRSPSPTMPATTNGWRATRAASSLAIGWRKRIPTPPCPIPSSRSSTISTPIRR
jgi:hypothetical protein